MRYSELFESSGYDANAKYAHYNAMLFGGELPKIPIVWSASKVVGGKVTYQLVRNTAVRVDPRMVRLGYHSKFEGAVLVPDSLKMMLSNTYKRDEQNQDAVLIHEMIHVYFAVNGEFDVDHGSKFVAKCRELSLKVGFEIPLTDDVSDLILASDRVVPIGAVILTKANGSKSFALMSAKNIHGMLGELTDRWQHLVNIGYVAGVSLVEVSSIAWTAASKQYPVQRTVKTMKFYVLSDENLIADLDHAKVIASFKKN